MNRRTRILTVLLALAILPYFLDLGGSSIWDANEAFYVETPREMMERGDYVSPRFNYEPRLNKPVLSYWIVAGFYHLFGVSPGVQRIPIAIGAMAIIAAAFLLAWAGSPTRASTAGEGSRAAEDRGAPNGDSRTADGAVPVPSPLEPALWAALALAVTPRLLMFARRIFIDIYISMFMALTLLFFALSERHPERRRRYLLMMYLSVGLGVLTKGPIAILLPGAVFALYLLVHRELRRAASMMVPSGILIVAAVVLPWYVALYLREGWEPIRFFISGENLARYTEGFGVDTTRGPFFYVPVLFSDSFPASLFLFAAAATWMADRRRASAETDPWRRVQTLLWLWILVIVIFFTASAAKQDLYIFPIVPAVAALAGLAIAAGLRGGTPGVGRTAAVIGTLVAIAGAGVVYLVGSPRSIYFLEGARPMGVAAVAGGIGALALASMGRARAAVTAVAATFVVLDWIFVLSVLPGFERYKPAPGFAETLRGRIAEEDLLVTYDEALPSLVYYLQRHIDPYFLPQELFEAFRSGRTVYAILSEDNYRELAPRLGAELCVIDRRPTFDVKLKNMLAREPLPELVLITNKCPGRRN